MAREVPMLSDQLTTETLGVLLHAAGAAQIAHLPPPWRIEANGHLIDVYLDGAHLLPAADPTARALRISTGACLQPALRRGVFELRPLCLRADENGRQMNALLTDDEVGTLLTAAVHAPSIHNTRWSAFR